MIDDEDQDVRSVLEHRRSHVGIENLQRGIAAGLTNFLGHLCNCKLQVCNQPRRLANLQSHLCN
jgi:hypothetical protein